ncbi:hypothetical protein BJ138DRAFT_964937, partial [Hygrophoropsis aurantiaca]
DAEIVPRSSDGADFRTYKLVPSLVSPMLKTMLSLLRPPDTATPPTPPVISMHEDRHTLEKLLLHCYPGFGTSLDSLDDIKVVLDAATKWGI